MIFNKESKTKKKLGAILLRPHATIPTLTFGKDGAEYRSWCDISGAGGCGDGYRIKRTT